MAKSAQDRRVYTPSTLGPSVIADLDTLLVALYVELTDRIIPARPTPAALGPGRPRVVTDAELVCLAVAQVLLRYNDEHHWLRAAPSRVGHLFPRLLSQPAYNRRLRQAAELMEAALRLAGRPHPGHRRAAAAAGRHPSGVRPFADHRQALAACSATPATATTPPTTASTGAAGCCWSVPPTGP